jgi:hypothetical protein
MREKGAERIPSCPMVEVQAATRSMGDPGTRAKSPGKNPGLERNKGSFKTTQQAQKGTNSI